jgi:hypothetical protein
MNSDITSFSKIKKIMLFLLASSYIAILAKYILFIEPAGIILSAHKIDYRAPYSGKVINIAKFADFMVEPGDLLFEIQRSESESDEQKQINLSLLEIDKEIKILNVVKNDLERRLFDDYSIPTSAIPGHEGSNDIKEVDRNFLDQRLIRVQQLILMGQERQRIEYEKLVAAEEKFTESRIVKIKAVESGRIVPIENKEGLNVFANDPIVSVVDCGTIHLDIFLDYNDASRFSIGDKLSFQIGDISRNWISRVVAQPFDVNFRESSEIPRIPKFPNGNLFFVRTLPEPSFLRYASSFEDCLIGRNISVNLAKYDLDKFLRSLIR